MEVAGVVHGVLGTHVMVDQVRQQLGVALGLHRAAHHPEGGPEGALSGSEAGDDRVQRALAGLEGVRVVGVGLKELPLFWRQTPVPSATTPLPKPL